MSGNYLFKLTDKEIKALIEAGGKAPSGGNVQPWKVNVSCNTLELRLDEKRSTSFLDVGRYASFFALGCFLENLLIAADYLGLKYELKVNEYKNINQPLVVVSFFEREKRKQSGSLYLFIEKRVSNRKLHDGTVINDSVIESLRNLVKDSSSNHKFHALSSNLDRKKIADILGVADAIRTVNNHMYNQFIKEFRWSKKETLATRDGMDLDTLELPKSAKKQLLLLRKVPFIRKVLPRKAFEETAKPMIKECSHICCLTLNNELTSVSMLLGGQILERLWLTMTRMGFYLHPWSILPFMIIRVEYFKGEGFSKEEIADIKKIREDFQQAFGLSEKELPIFIFRLFKGESPTERSLRLDWKEYTKIMAK